MTGEPHSPGRSPGGAGDAVVTRSEEELRVFTRRRATRRARLEKTIETHMQTVTRTVPLRRERVQIEYVALADDPMQPAVEHPTGERWLVLYEEEVVVHTRWVARERVRLAVHAVTEDREITERVRREQLTVEKAPRDR